MINFDLSRDEYALVREIARRAIALSDERIELLDLEMDIVACHNHGCRLDLEALAKADNFNLAHDVFGIRRHLDRDTGELDGRFLPRFAARVATPSTEGGAS